MSIQGQPPTEYSISTLGRLHIAPGHLVRHDPSLNRNGGSPPGRFTHGYCVACHAIAGMSQKVTANAAAGHHEAVNIGSDQCRERNVIGFGTHRSITAHFGWSVPLGEN